MAVTTICLVRHGEADWNRQGRLQGREDVELNDIHCREDTWQIETYNSTAHIAENA